MITYQGKRAPGGVQVNVIGKRGAKPLRHVNYHSPDGFEWGYEGSAPADLALSILAHHLGESWVTGPYLHRLKPGRQSPLCWMFHQDFKREVIAQFSGDSFELTQAQISTWLANQRSESSKSDRDALHYQQVYDDRPGAEYNCWNCHDQGCYQCVDARDLYD